jgi:hypothetical protein
MEHNRTLYHVAAGLVPWNTLASPVPVPPMTESSNKIAWQ